MLARFLGISYHDLTDLIGDLRATAGDKLVMHPGDDDNVAVAAVAKACVKLVMNVDEPSLANHRFGAGYRVVERLVLCEHRNASTVKSGQPAALRLRREFRPQLA